MTGVEAVPLSGGGSTLRSPVCGGLITPLDSQPGALEFEGAFGAVAGGPHGVGAGLACGVCVSGVAATAVKLPAAMSAANRSPNRLIFMTSAFPVRAEPSNRKRLRGARNSGTCAAGRPPASRGLETLQTAGKLARVWA